MKILSAVQIKAWDQYTINNEPISSLDLMERASMVFTNWFTQIYDYKNCNIHIFCGPGNNGGDGLAIARLLHHSFYNVHVYLCHIGKDKSVDFEKNLSRLPRHNAIAITEINEGNSLPSFSKNDIIIDGIFGSGLNRPIDGYWNQLIEHLNQQNSTRVAIDIPSGLFADQHTVGLIFQAHRTLCFEGPKLSFLFPENESKLGTWNFESIGLMSSFLEKTSVDNYYIDLNFAKAFYKKRNKFDHKGSYGHALLVAGSYGMIGAALLSTKAALRTGAGLVTLHTPKVAYPIVQSNIPEAIVQLDPEEFYISEIIDSSKHKAIGIGPGIGNNSLTVNALMLFLKSHTSALVLDADALNIIATNQNLYALIPKESILTPHPKEFERLFGKSENDFKRNELQRTKAVELGVYIVLKGAHTCIACPDGSCYFNSTGNPGMATAGSGDVLTGMITGLLAQGYSPKESAILGVFLHGLSGDLGLEKVGSEEALIASDIIESIGHSFSKINYTNS